MKQPSYMILSFKNIPVPRSLSGFVAKNWMISYRFGNEYIRLIDKSSYYKVYTQLINKIIHSPDVETRIAVLSDDQDVTLGFSVLKNSLLHYVYVGASFRNIGIARKLIPNQIDTFTHLTKKGLQLWNDKAPKAIFNPFF